MDIPDYIREVQLLAELAAGPNMLKKLLKVHKLTTPFHKVPHKLAAGAASSLSESPSALKIVHAGGFVWCYYMTIPAVRILEKYPSCMLARPEVFRRPWESVARPEEILALGEKFFLVPRCTVRKLRLRITKPDREFSSNSFASKSCIDVSVDKVSCTSNDFSGKSFCQQSEADVSVEKTAVRKHVRFAGTEEKDSKLGDNPGNNSSNSPPHEAKRRSRNAAPSWQPSLMAICERNDE